MASTCGTWWFCIIILVCNIETVSCLQTSNESVHSQAKIICTRYTNHVSFCQFELVSFRVACVCEHFNADPTMDLDRLGFVWWFCLSYLFNTLFHAESLDSQLFRHQRKKCVYVCVLPSCQYFLLHSLNLTSTYFRFGPFLFSLLSSANKESTCIEAYIFYADFYLMSP